MDQVSTCLPTHKLPREIIKNGPGLCQGSGAQLIEPNTAKHIILRQQLADMMAP